MPGAEDQLRFDDGKDPGALRTIGEVTAALGIKQHVLRYWEAQFPMLRPLKRSGGRRYYRPADIALVVAIDRLVNREGFTLRGARAALEKGNPAADQVPDPAQPPVRTQARPVHAEIVQAAVFLPQLRALRDRLSAALAG